MSSTTYTGGCDTPTCTGDAETITPEGYVCSSCASEIAAHYNEARDRDAAARGDRC